MAPSFQKHLLHKSRQGELPFGHKHQSGPWPLGTGLWGHRPVSPNNAGRSDHLSSTLQMRKLRLGGRVWDWNATLRPEPPEPSEPRDRPQRWAPRRPEGPAGPRLLPAPGRESTARLAICLRRVGDSIMSGPLNVSTSSTRAIPQAAHTRSGRQRRNRGAGRWRTSWRSCAGPSGLCAGCREAVEGRISLCSRVSQGPCAEKEQATLDLAARCPRLATAQRGPGPLGSVTQKGPRQLCAPCHHWRSFQVSPLTLRQPETGYSHVSATSSR